MDGHPGLTALIESAWKELSGSDAGRRDLCLDVVGDVLETGRLMPGDAEQVVERLVTVALSGEGYAVRESALHAACTASTHYELSYRVVEPLAVGADVFEPLLLDYVLAVLGATHDQAALPVVERFLQHPHPEVRRAAAEAVNELRWSRQSPLGKERPSSSGAQVAPP
ncbi:HEAT repeat domain-containing protein [Streptomyces sp. NPDC059851]|uniref:HEAT repeat domain-containing protein n=1 Tax=Streptomyces sp. NPDC059851 TaxID=3346971 RepID=UPI00365FBEDA